MKNLIAVIIFAFMASFLKANTEPLESKYVYAFSGLKLRSLPGVEGDVIKVIPFGAKVQILEMTNLEETIEWMQGSWVKVSHEGTSGYLFEGFISELPLPENSFEMSQNDLDLTYPILGWAEYNFDQVLKADTIEQVNLFKVKQYFENGTTISRVDNPHNFKVTMELENTKLNDVYNLLKSMLLTKNERVEFDKQAVFIDSQNQGVDKIRINFEKPVIIKQLKNGKIKVTVTSFHQGCDVF